MSVLLSTSFLVDMMLHDANPAVSHASMIKTSLRAALVLPNYFVWQSLCDVRLLGLTLPTTPMLHDANLAFSHANMIKTSLCAALVPPSSL